MNWSGSGHSATPDRRRVLYSEHRLGGRAGCDFIHLNHAPDQLQRLAGADDGLLFEQGSQQITQLEDRNTPILRRQVHALPLRDLSQRPCG